MSFGIPVVAGAVGKAAHGTVGRDGFSVGNPAIACRNP